MNENDECSICLEKLKMYNYVLLDCNHMIHYQCLEKWIKANNDDKKLCPFCQKNGEIINIVEIEKKEEKENSNEPLEDIDTIQLSDPYNLLYCCTIL